MKTFTESQVKFLLRYQRHNCQVERNKRSLHDESGFYVHCDDVLNAEEPDIHDESTFDNLGLEIMKECEEHKKTDGTWVAINSALLALSRGEVLPGQVLDFIQESMTPFEGD
jgi:hypothetical protein